jgi:hypothetical protein
LLQSAYSDYQIRPFENLHQLVENTSLVVLWARLKIFIQYSLRFAYRLKRQLLISHCFFPIKKWLTCEADREIKSALRLSHQFLFRCWNLYLVIAFLFGPKMWRRFAGSDKKGCQVPARAKLVISQEMMVGPASGQFRKSDSVRARSVHASTADMKRLRPHVRFVPTAEVS